MCVTVVGDLVDRQPARETFRHGEFTVPARFFEDGMRLSSISDVVEFARRAVVLTAHHAPVDAYLKRTLDQVTAGRPVPDGGRIFTNVVYGIVLLVTAKPASAPRPQQLSDEDTALVAHCTDVERRYQTVCGGGRFCEHAVDRFTCVPCDGPGICEHKVQRYTCVPCDGPGICKHERIRSQCGQCGNTNRRAVKCHHKGARGAHLRRSQCPTCKPSFQRPKPKPK